MNICEGDQISWVSRKGNWFTATVKRSYYNEKGHHIFQLKHIDYSYAQKPKCKWRGKDLYPRVYSHTPGENHAEFADIKKYQKECAGIAQYQEAPEIDYMAEMAETFERARFEEAEYASKGIFDGDTLEEYFEVYVNHRDSRDRFSTLEAAIRCAERSSKKSYFEGATISKVEIPLVRNGAVCPDTGYQILVRGCKITQIMKI